MLTIPSAKFHTYTGHTGGNPVNLIVLN
jgi:hypothetical protein